MPITPIVPGVTSAEDAAIRINAALVVGDLSPVAVSNSYTDLDDKPDPGPPANSWEIDVFSGTGEEEEYTLTASPGSTTNMFVTIDGVTQHVSSYAVSGTTLTMTAPVGTNNIQVRYGGAVDIGSPSNGSVGAAQIDSGDVAAIQALLGIGAAGAYELGFVENRGHYAKFPLDESDTGLMVCWHVVAPRTLTFTDSPPRNGPHSWVYPVAFDSPPVAFVQQTGGYWLSYLAADATEAGYYAGYLSTGDFSVGHFCLAVGRWAEVEEDE